MAKSEGVVTLRGRFKAGAQVRLVRVAHEGVLRAGDGEVVASEKVDDGGCVQFSEGVEVGGRYFIVGQIDGEPVEVRVRGNAPDDDNSHLVQPPVQPDRQKLASGVWQDELVLTSTPRQATKKPSPPDSSGMVDVSPAPTPARRRRPAAKKSAERKPAAKTSSASAAKKPAAKSPAPKTTTAKTSASRSARKEK